MPWRWIFWLAGVALCAALYLAAWPLAWRLAMVPHISRERQGLEALTFASEDASGREIFSQRVPAAALNLDRPQAAQVAMGVWVTPREGLYRLALECDDYGRVLIDRRPIISLGGTSALNQGAVEVLLTPGPHLLTLELHNRQGVGWLRLLAAGPDQPQPELLAGDQLRGVDLGNYRAWVGASAWLERVALLGLAVAFVAFFLLWAWPGPGRSPPWPSGWRARAGAAVFLAAVLAFSALSSWHTVSRHVGWLDRASGHEYLSHEELTWHRIMVEGRHQDHRVFRVLPDWLLAGFESLLSGRDQDPSPASMLFGLRWLIDLLIFILAALFYRRLGLSRASALLGLAVLAWAMYPTRYRAGINFATFLDVVLYLLAGLLLAQGRTMALVPLAGLAALNKETSLMIPFLPLAAALPWPPRWRLPRPDLKASGLALSLWLMVYAGLRLLRGWEGAAKPHDQPGLDFLFFNLFGDPDSWSNVYYTLGVLPILAAVYLRRSPALLQRLFWAVAPAWLLVHTFIAFWAETRVFMPPMALVFIPACLFAAGGGRPTPDPGA